MALLLNRFRGKGLYILDEPEAALSPQRQLAVLSRIHDLVMDDSQFIIATHSPILMSYPNATIYTVHRWDKKDRLLRDRALPSDARFLDQSQAHAGRSTGAVV
jgi:predicted ATPase